MTEATDAREAMAVSKQIYLLLHGRGPEVQGAVLIDLLAMFHRPGLREEQLRLMTKTVRELVPVCEAQLLEQHGGRPEGWSKQ